MTDAAHVLHREFSARPGAQQIATPFAVAHLYRWLYRRAPQRVLEIGAGIGTLSAAIGHYLILNDAEAVSVEDDPWCRSQWAQNVPGRVASRPPLLYDKIPNYEFFDLVVLDGPQTSLEAWAGVMPRGVVFVEGNRRAQRAHLEAWCRHVGRPFCKAQWKPPDRSKGCWVYLLEPRWVDYGWFAGVRLRESWRDMQARLEGRAVGKKAHADL